MKLETFKDNNNLSYSELSEKLRISRTRLYEICREAGPSPRVEEVNLIVNGTAGAVTPCDLGLFLPPAVLVGGCACR